MARTTTLAIMRASVRKRGDFDNSRVITDAMVDAAINRGIAKVWDVMLDARPDYYLATSSPVTVANQATITLPTDFYQLRKLEVLDGGDYRKVLPHNLSDSQRFTGDASRLFRYRIQGSASLTLVPTPTQVWALRLYYLPHAPLLDDDADTFDGISGYEDMVESEAIYDLKKREGMPAEEWYRTASELRAQIRGAAEVDVGEPVYFGPGPGDDDDDWSAM